MSETNQIVRFDLDRSNKIELYGQITSRMESMGYGACDFEALDLGFEVPAGWPVDKNTEPTLAQLVVLAKKLGMQVNIERVSISVMPPVVDEDGQADCRNCNGQAGGCNIDGLCDPKS